MRKVSLNAPRVPLPSSRLKNELANALPRVQCLELEIEHMTGKLVKES